jgi:CheY-like chemotaxis protein
MDHSYRNNQGEQGQGGFSNRGRQGFNAPARFFQAPDIEPLPTREDAAPRIFAFIDDLFFVAEIQETARKLNIKVEFVKNDKEILDKMAETGNGHKPALIIFDLNNLNAKPLTTIPKLKSKFKKDTAIIGFVSHIQGDLKMKALDAGCDMVVPRSAFSQNLPQLLRRHAADEEEEQETPQA